jgi:putative restriction endonuclease
VYPAVSSTLRKHNEPYRGDAAFDQGLVSFADDGRPLASPQLSAVARQALGIDTAPALRGLRDAHRANLAAHRARHGF